MDLQQVKMDNYLLIRLTGQLDTGNSLIFKESLTDIVDKGEKIIVIDCSGLEFINSAGLGALLVNAKKLSADEGRIIIFGLKKHIEEIFELTGFNEVVDIVEDSHSAVERTKIYFRWTNFIYFVEIFIDLFFSSFNSSGIILNPNFSYSPSASLVANIQFGLSNL